jgi:diadenylate cyclase
LGITEVSDAVAIVVSEETGVISLTNAGKINRYLDEKSLREKLRALYTPESKLFNINNLRNWRPKRNGGEKKK